jgi:hypothetical protein
MTHKVSPTARIVCAHLICFVVTCDGNDCNMGYEDMNLLFISENVKVFFPLYHRVKIGVCEYGDGTNSRNYKLSKCA